MRIALLALTVAALAATPSPVLAQAPQPSPSDAAAALLAEPLTPGVVALLGELAGDSRGQTRLTQALASPDAAVRAVAARIATSTRSVGQVPAIRRALAAEGDRRQVDLLVGDIYRAGAGTLPGDLTAASFAKLASTRPPDVAHAVMGLVGENVALVAGGLARAVGVEAVVYCGSTLADNPSLRDIVARVTMMQGLDGRFLAVYQGRLLAEQPSPSPDFVLIPRHQTRGHRLSASQRPSRTGGRYLRTPETAPSRAARARASTAARPGGPAAAHPWRRAFTRRGRQIARTPKPGGTFSRNS